MKTKFTHFLNEKKGITPSELTSIINSTIEMYKSKRMKPIQINDGYCMDFAEDVADEVGYEGVDNDFHRVYIEYLYDFDDLDSYDEDQLFDDERLIKWNKQSVEQYGGMPDIDNIEDYIPDTHVWLSLNGKHYDAENTTGVDKWYELNFYKRDIAKFKKQSK